VIAAERGDPPRGITPLAVDPHDPFAPY
jgi:hypothetical protein